ncbi:MAG: hypothetical protein H2172_18335 [Opitutus sp.]|nr:hypothetical protein [Opitutus sp.]MCS6248500.1 hypothetical protein [Opitutus sp.]MCS6275274.1 hypothetical protein [Opitutus sp.]MCS6278369.1 hypothetical protein [Opitutus sp.]MCS6299479.1 hypothetical protein [Opitutus sp.]
MKALAIEPETIGHPFVRTLVIVRSHRVVKHTGEGKPLTRYYLSSRLPDAHTPAQWLGLIRGHWAGVENRNHWRRDALFGEDHSRTRNVNALANLALLRSAVLRLFASHFPSASTPVILETLHSNPARCLALACSHPR